MENNPIKIVQISDTHLYSDTKKELLSVNTNESLHKVLSLIKKNHSNDLSMILLTGDITQDYSDNAYIRIAEDLSTFQVPVYCLPGNHDDVEEMKRIYPHKTVSYQNQIVLKHWNFIFLNSQLRGTAAGNLTKEELNMMEKCLIKYPNKHAMIVLHHHPLPVGSKWLDNLAVGNADEFWQIVDRYPQIKVVLYGHIHQKYENSRKGVICLGTPSTCIQFDPKYNNFKLENVPPGYRWLNLENNGEITTGVNRLPHYVGHYDGKATGY